MAHSRFEYVKTFETDDRLLPDCWMVVRVDGKQFKLFTDDHNFQKPHDDRGIKLMNRAASEVMKQCKDIVLAIGASDEYSFVLRRDSVLFNRRSSKINTFIVSLFTSSFVYYWNDYFGENVSSICAEFRSTNDECSSMVSCQPLPESYFNLGSSSEKLSLFQEREKKRANDPTPGQKLLYPPSFDGRMVLYPTDRSLKDYLSWRQADFHINNMYNMCFWQLVFDGLTPQNAESKLNGTFSEQKNNILFDNYGINYAKLPSCYRKGSVLIWDPRTFKNIESIEGEEPKRLKSSIDEHPSIGQLTKMTASENVIALHKDLIKESFWEEYTGLIPYIAPSERRKLLKKKIKAERREKHKQNPKIES